MFTKTFTLLTVIISIMFITSSGNTWIEAIIWQIVYAWLYSILPAWIIWFIFNDLDNG